MAAGAERLPRESHPPITMADQELSRVHKVYQAAATSKKLEECDGDGAHLRYHAEGRRAGAGLFHEYRGKAETGAAAGKPWRGRDRSGLSHRFESAFRSGAPGAAPSSAPHHRATAAYTHAR